MEVWIVTTKLVEDLDAGSTAQAMEAASSSVRGWKKRARFSVDGVIVSEDKAL